MASASLVLLSSTSGNFTVNYVEPTTNADGSPLTNLAKVNIDVAYDGGAFSQLAVETASAPTGGGVKNKAFNNVSLPATATSAVVRLKAINTIGNQSSVVDLSIVIDRPVPAPVT